MNCRLQGFVAYEENLLDASFYQSYYQSHARRFDETRLWKSQEIEHTVQLVSERFTPRSSLLEVGCGSFRHGAMLVSRGYSVIGIDFSHQQLSNAHGAPLICGDVTSLPIRSDTADGLLAIMSLHQVAQDSQDSALSEIARVLRPGGSLLIKTCTHDDLRRRPLAKWFPSSLSVNLRRFLDDADLRKSMSGSGLVVVEEWSTETASSFGGAQLLAALETRPSSSLKLVPDEEYERGLAEFRQSIDPDSSVDLSHYHTYYVAKKES